MPRPESSGALETETLGEQARIALHRITGLSEGYKKLILEAIQQAEEDVNAAKISMIHSALLHGTDGAKALIRDLLKSAA